MYTKELMGIPWLLMGQDSVLTAEGMSSIPVQGAKFHKLCSKEKKKSSKTYQLLRNKSMKTMQELYTKIKLLRIIKNVNTWKDIS